ncbi:MAG TPA: quinone oxidoreductase [Caldilineaceae bacterium]|nr:quinone oxidoreductase [Caldilineaceae bacterium]
MKAIRVHETGDVSKLVYEDAPMPEPKEGEVRVKVEAAGLNFIDTYHRMGWYPLSTPFTLGLEAGGVVDAVGAGVTEFKPGDRVGYCMHQGAYAEYATVPARMVVPVPEGVSTEQAAAVLLQGMTAHYLTNSTYPLNEGDIALVHAAAGGTGALVVQMAKLRGAHVIGTVGTDEKAAVAKAAGADDVIVYTKQDFEAEVKRITDGKLCHVVYESVGKATFDKSMNCLRPRGYMVLFGQASGQVAPLDPQILNQKGSLFLTRPSLGAYVATREELLSRANDIFQWIATGKLDVRIDKSYPLSEAGAAHTYLEGRQTKGKVLLIP